MIWWIIGYMLICTFLAVAACMRSSQFSREEENRGR